MTDIDQLQGWLHEVDPAVGIDRSPDGPDADRLYVRALGSNISASAATRHRRSEAIAPVKPHAIRRRSLLLGAAAALISVAILVAPSALNRGTPAYAIHRLPDGKIEIDWSADDYRADADAIARDLREYGMDVEIVTLPSSPSAVGFVTAVFEQNQPTDGPPAGLDINEGTAAGLIWTIDPARFHGPVTLNVDVPADPGEPYLDSNSVFMSGEVLGGLQCALGEPIRATDVAAHLGALGLTAEWYVVDPTSISAHYYSEDRVTEVPDGTIFEGHALDDTSVELHIAPDGVQASDLHAGSLSNEPCTHQLRAPWA